MARDARARRTGTGLGRVSEARVLVVNAGSSSLKLALLGGEDRLLAASELGPLEGPKGLDQLRRAVRSGLSDAQAVGHRIVHGGTRFSGPALLDADVEGELRALSELAPLHQERGLRALDAVRELLPRLPAVACFDTAFHAEMPAAARTYAVPEEWGEGDTLRRYGFHGLSHSWAAIRAPELLGAERGDLAIVSCHLGAGASLCAIDGGRSIDTTMGFTPLEGLVMATRSGSVDPGMLLWLQRRRGITAAQLDDALEHRSGLLALAGSADMREVLAAAARGDERAQLALDVYVHRLRGGIAAMAAALGRLDVLVFTGGVGERAAPVRAAAVAGLRLLGVGLDERRNLEIGRERAEDGEITATGARVRTVVVRAREDIQIARQTRGLIPGS